MVDDRYDTTLQLARCLGGSNDGQNLDLSGVVLKSCIFEPRTSDSMLAIPPASYIYSCITSVSQSCLDVDEHQASRYTSLIFLANVSSFSGGLREYAHYIKCVWLLMTVDLQPHLFPNGQEAQHTACSMLPGLRSVHLVGRKTYRGHRRKNPPVLNI